MRLLLPQLIIRWICLLDGVPIVHFFPMTLIAPKLASQLGIAIFSETNYASTICAPRWLICGWIFKFLEIIFIGSIPHVHFRHERFPAFFAVFPMTCVFLVVMIATKRMSSVVSVA